MSRAWDKLIVALDVTSKEKIRSVIETLTPKVRKFKIGLIAYTKFGPQAIQWVNKKRAKVFLDFKLYDIPNTMVEVATSFIDLGVWAFTVHIKAGEENLRFLKKVILKEATRKRKKPPLIIGVTELTSRRVSLAKVLNLAKIASLSGLDGVVCSVWEAKKIKEKFGLLTITPGIRKTKGRDDQKRVATVKSALKNKVDYFVVGRPIIHQKNYLKAAEDILSSGGDR